ncbi:superkiller viralicidic activity 2-like W [Gracilaria domingensis]|nr:superkiller viralicidic activity 2-like W [Gracilaria domingensis]
MLYKKADLIRDLSHVIVEEFHWVNDPKRDVVWEESIILLPAAVSIVMLSATVQNSLEFARWVGRTRQKTVYVVSTRQRPVLLVLQMFIKGMTFLLLNSSQGKFLYAKYKKSAARHKEMAEKANIRFGGGRFHAWMPIIRYLRKNSLDPAIFFCFGKRKCDDTAKQLTAQDLTESSSDKNEIHMLYQSAISRPFTVDRDVPQIARHRETLKSGIGVHHAGLLPIIKEKTEVLFQRGLIRILFATETFAMGVNMPARTVVFTAINKYDSQSLRLLEPGEYIQMAGRAERRGLDDVVSVILYPVLADFPLESDIISVLIGRPKPLKSPFRLTYNMILNLLRIDEMRVGDFMARSFSEAPAGRTSRTVRKLMKRGNAALSALQEEELELDRFREIYHLSLRLDNLSAKIGDVMNNQGKNTMNSVLDSGRVVVVKEGDGTFQLAVIVQDAGTSRGKGPTLRKPAGPSLCLPRKGGPKGSDNRLKVMVLCGGPRMSEDKTPLRDSVSEGVNVRLKGRAACEVKTCKNIFLRELVIEQVLQKLDAADLAAMLSAMLFTEKTGNEKEQFSVESLGEGCEELKNAMKATITVLHWLGDMKPDCGIAT